MGRPPTLRPIEEPLLLNNSGKLIDLGTSKITDAQVSQLKGHYIPLSRDLAPSDIILPLVRIPKKHGHRLIANLPTASLLSKGITLPEWCAHTDAHLDLRTTITQFVGLISTAPVGSIAISVDLSNAYANIPYSGDNIHFRSASGSLYTLAQPVQGLATSGRVAPHRLFCYFRDLSRLLRSHFHHDYIGLTSYSDNALLVCTPQIVNAMLTILRATLGPLFNEAQLRLSSSGSFQALGFRFSAQPLGFCIRKPRNSCKQARSFYDFILGKRNVIHCLYATPISIYCDGVSSDHVGVAAAIMGQQQPHGKYKILFGHRTTRTGIDQLASEALSISLGSHLQHTLQPAAKPQSILTDSKICVDISRQKRPRISVEQGLLQGVNLQFISTTANLADAHTREDTTFTCRPPKRMRLHV